MGDEKIFIGTLNELASKLLEEYINQKSFSKTQISYSPKEDSVASGEVTAQSKGLTLTLSLSNENDKQIDNIKVFSDEYINGFTNKILRKGQVYQLTLVFAYKDENSDVKCKYPSLSGNWAEWEIYWQNNTPDTDCIAFAAVNLLEGESIKSGITLEAFTNDISKVKSDLLSRTIDNTYVFNIAELKEKGVLTTTMSQPRETGDTEYPYEVLYTQEIVLGEYDRDTSTFNSDFDTDFGIEFYDNFYPSINCGKISTLYFSIDYKVPKIIEWYQDQGILMLDIRTNKVEEGIFYNDDIVLRRELYIGFVDDPTGWENELMFDFLDGSNEMGFGVMLESFYTRIEVPKTKEIKVI